MYICMYMYIYIHTEIYFEIKGHLSIQPYAKMR